MKNLKKLCTEVVCFYTIYSLYHSVLKLVDICCSHSVALIVFIGFMKCGFSSFVLFDKIELLDVDIVLLVYHLLKSSVP